MKVVKLAYGQTLYDLAVQEYGHTDGFFVILEDNPGIVQDLADVPAPGTEVMIRDVPVINDDNRSIAAEIKRKERRVVSGSTATPIAGDGYWEEDYSEQDYVE